MEVESCVPPGFRFHPTEEELVGYYLARKIASQKTDLEVITDIDLYRIEPWDLQDRCSLGYEEQSEWFFFSHKDKKYPTGTRTNRATTAGFWKATGRDKAVVSNSRLIGMRKTLVFYIGRAPNGRKTDWIIHEYRLQSSEHEPPQEEGWVVCRAFKKQIPNQRQGFNNFSPNYRSCRDHDQFGSETPFMGPFFGRNLHGIPFGGGGNQLESRHSPSLVPDILQLDSPNLSANLPTKECFEHNIATNKDCVSQKEETMGQFIDWKDLDKLLASQSSESTSYLSSNLPIVSLDCGADDPNHDQFLASFDT